MRARILLVDDSEDILETLRDFLAETYDVDAAGSGAEGLEYLKGSRNYAVVISDLHMPRMNGLEFLRQCELHSPLTTRLLFSGDAGSRMANSALDVSLCFRVLPKTTPLAEFLSIVALAVRHHERAEVEHELLESTLRQSVCLLLDIFSATAPASFEMSLRLQRTVRQFAEAANLPSPWEVEMAAGLARIGAATLPPAVVAKFSSREKLNLAEKTLVEKIPEISARMIEAIPRMKGVAEIVRYQWKHFDGSGVPRDPRAGDAIPRGARILKIFTDRAWLELDGVAKNEARQTMEARKGVYDPELLAASFRIFPDFIIQEEPAPAQIVMLPESDLKPKQVAVMDIVTTTGLRLVAAGSRLTAAAIQRIRNHCELGNLSGPFCVREVVSARTKKARS